MTDNNVVRSLMRAEAPKTISKEQLFVYVPKDYTTTKGKATSGAKIAIKNAETSMKWAVGKKFAFTITPGVELSDPYLFLAMVGGEVSSDLFLFEFEKSTTQEEWYLGGLWQGTRVVLSDYGIEEPDDLNEFEITVQYADVVSGDTGYQNNSKYFAEQAEVSAKTAENRASEAADSAASASGAAARAEGASDAASGYADTASSAAQSASESATEAASSASSAAESATEAAGYVDEMGVLYNAKLDKKPNGTTDLINAGTGKIDNMYMPTGIVGGMNFKGTWNATTGVANPPITSADVAVGDYWICSKTERDNPKFPGGVDATTSVREFVVGDWSVIVKKTTEGLVSWAVVDNDDAVISVNDKIGKVVLAASDIFATNTQSVQQNLERIDGSIEDLYENTQQSQKIVETDTQTVLDDSEHTSVPTMTVAEFDEIYSAIGDGREAIIYDTIGESVTYVISLDSSGSSQTGFVEKLYCLFAGRLALTYKKANNAVTIEYKEIGVSDQPLVIQATANKTVNGYQVPQLSDQNLVDISNAVVAGRSVTITDATGAMSFTDINVDTVASDIFVTFRYFDKMILEYGEGNVTNFVKLGGSVTDVQVGGTTVVNASGVANIPIASGSNLGVVKISGSGLSINASTGAVSISAASSSTIENKNSAYQPIVPTNLDKAVMEGLGNNSLTWSAAYKASACAKIGAQTELVNLVEEGL